MTSFVHDSSMVGLEGSSDCGLSKFGSKHGLQQKELMAWNSVSRRIAAVFVEAASEIKAEELKNAALSCPHGELTMKRQVSLHSDCANAMCSPAPSSVFPTDVSTTAGTMCAALSEVASDESGNEGDYDFFSELDDSDDEFSSPNTAFHGMEKSFPSIGLRTGFKTMSTSFKKDIRSPTAQSQENWHCVGKRLAAVMLNISSSDDEDFPVGNLPHYED
jgi:hypothetical protein